MASGATETVPMLIMAPLRYNLDWSAWPANYATSSHMETHAYWSSNILQADFDDCGAMTQGLAMNNLCVAGLPNGRLCYKSNRLCPASCSQCCMPAAETSSNATPWSTTKRTPWSTHTRDSRYLFLYIYATKYGNVNHPVLQWACLGLG